MIPHDKIYAELTDEMEKFLHKELIKTYSLETPLKVEEKKCPDDGLKEINVVFNGNFDKCIKFKHDDKKMVWFNDRQNCDGPILLIGKECLKIVLIELKSSYRNNREKTQDQIHASALLMFSILKIMDINPLKHEWVGYSYYKKSKLNPHVDIIELQYRDHISKPEEYIIRNLPWGHCKKFLVKHEMVENGETVTI
ncbi:hypothetical protein [Methanococcus maripaludis]|uniref:Uncharacterized protein n=1 Tax=Methanococcus maripaludis TaxID=39152 RepID=A0A7J9PLF5_METMI|nr:hypothetical protein [Methanococcus maripaludis]MBA2864052.1 hypothetical protein [Methanococcus maripaludis]